MSNSVSARDFVEPLDIYRPRRPRTKAEVLRPMYQSHRARQSDLDTYRRRPRRAAGS